MARDSTPPPEGAARLVRLDGLRGLAACMVAFPYHARFLAEPAAFQGMVGSPVLAWLHDFGWTFVDLFFVLSGYVFAHVYIGRDALKTRADLADFAIARIARLYPLHLVMLLGTAVFLYGRPDNGAVPFAANLLMLQAFLRPFAASFDSPSWSLSVEAFCYLLFAAGAVVGRRALLLMTAFLVVLAGIRLGIVGLPGGPYVSDVLPRGLLGFFVGQALWHGRGWTARVPSVVLWAALVAGVLMAPLQISPLVPLTLLAWPAALVLALRLRWLESAPMVWLGDRSYAIYLVNLPLIWAVGYFAGPPSASGWVALGLNLAVVAIVLVASDLSLRLVEQPGRTAIRRAWLKHRERAAAARPAGAGAGVAEPGARPLSFDRPLG